MSIKIIISALVLSLCSSFSAADKGVNKNGFAVGLGIPYGGAGINVSRNITEKLELMGGFGIFGWAAGARFYPANETPNFRFSGIYGTNTIVMVDKCQNLGSSSFCTTEFKHYEGLNLGIGFGPRGDDNGWNVDLILILTRGNFNSDRDDMEAEGYEIDSDGGAIKFSGGYTWRF
jgi:hypothetical protein